MFKDIDENFKGTETLIVDTIKDLIRDNDYVSEIETNGPGVLFYKERGVRKEMPIALKNEVEYNKAIDYLIQSAGLEKNKYLVEGRYVLPGGRYGRLHIAMPPATPYPLVTLALKTSNLKDITSIQGSGSFNSEIALFLRAAVASKLTTVLSGGTGAGKALHKDTLIPTPYGMKTVGELNVGDIIFDENGNETKIERKYCPEDPQSYEIEFKSGQKVKTSAGHLWKVTKLNEKENIGPNREAVLNEEEICELENELNKSDNKQYISRKEVLKLLKGKTNIVDKITKDIKKYHGKHLVKFNAEELAFLKEKVKLLSHIQFEEKELTWEKFNSLTEQRINSNYVRDALKNKKFSTEEIYYDHKEFLKSAIRECKSRIEWKSKREEHISKTDIRPREIMSTEEMFQYGVINKRNRLNFAIGYLSEELKYEKKELMIDPYTLGAWLGDGISDRAVICGEDIEINNKILQKYQLKKENKFSNKKGEKYLYDWRYEGLVEKLKHYNLLRNKHIPIDYKLSSKEQRIELLAGLVDTDGSVDKKGIVSFGNTIKSIVEDAREIVMSLGWSATQITSKIGTYKHEETGEIVECKEIYTFSFVGEGLNLEVPRKQERIEARRKLQKSQQIRHRRHYVVDIRKIEDNPADYYCFQVDSPSHLFLCTEEFIPTHNTTMLEALTNEFGEQERIGVCEDTPELELKGLNTAYLSSTVRVPGMSADEIADLSWTVQQINRMRVDRVLIGETRGKEFFDFIIAANSGKPGSLTTIHANDGPSALKKMATFMYMAVDMSPRIINEMISEAVDIVIQLGTNEKTGAHKIISINEVTNAISSGDSPTIAMNPLFTYDHDSDTWTKRYATDTLKKKLIQGGYDPNTYTKIEREEENQGFSGGLPAYFNK